jgi:FixJ family two-component response regulator
LYIAAVLDNKVVMRSNKRLKADEFEALLPYLERLGDRNVKAARSIMVDGRQQSQVAAELGVSKSSASAVVCRVWNLHLEHGTRPIGWVRVSVVLPQDLAEVVKDMERKALEHYKAAS